MKTGIELIAEERKRQVEVEGWTSAHDSRHEQGEIALAAACYAMPGDILPMKNLRPLYWPWDVKWWKPTPKDRVKELVKAGALIAAEIDRLQTK